MQLTNLSDVQLVEKFKQHKDTLFVEELYRRYAKRVYWWAVKFLQNSLEAEEMVQEIFIAMMSTMLDNYQPREDAKFSSWLYRCVGNHCLKVLRGRYELLNKQVEIDDIPKQLIANIDLDRSMLLNEQTTMLNKALSQLNNMQRTCCIKFYWEGYRYEEIAEELGITYDQVRSHLQNSLRNLKLAVQRMAQTQK